MRKLIFVLLIILLLLVSCSEEDESFPVMLSCGDGVTVLSQNPQTVKPGESVSFVLEISPDYAFHSSSAGSFDYESSTLTVDNVTGCMNVSFYTINVDYDTTESVIYLFKGEAGDVDGVDGQKVRLGEKVRVKAQNTDKIFLGWSFGKAFSGGGELVSSERDYEFRVNPSILRNGVMFVYANYVEDSSNIFFYDANGGSVNPDSDNMSYSDYYTATHNGSTVQITLKEKYFSFSAAASTFYDDGTFQKDGYVLAEYNTAPDGSGEAYSLGSKFYAGGDGISTLYCIWKKDTQHTDFVYTDYEYPCPVNKSYAPDWQENGVIITGYLGDDREVVIPEKIDGKYVIAIAAGAFRDKSMTQLFLSKRLQSIADGAFVNCSLLETVYFSDGIYSISDACFDSASYRSFKKLYVNATIAPRFSNSADGAFAVKLSRLLEKEGEKRIIVIAGSSTYEGLATEYLEALFNGEYSVINFGTTRTTHGLIYLEAMSELAGDDDIIIYAPENSAYMMGERELYWKTLRDLEGMNNFFRYIDISNYTGVFTAFSDFNKNYRYKRAECRYEDICEALRFMNKYGEQQDEKRKVLGYPNYIDAYYITMNERYKSKFEGHWSAVVEQEKNKDYTDLNNVTWQSISAPDYTALVNHAIRAAKSSGAKVGFGFCPADADALVAAAKNRAWLAEYDALIDSLYEFDFLLGKSEDYVFNHKYFYDCAFHLNDYGRTYRTYRFYLDLSARLGASSTFGIYDCGMDFEGCCFEENSDGTPNLSVAFLEGVES